MHNVNPQISTGLQRIVKKLQYKAKYKQWFEVEKNAIILNSIPKSGTNRFRIFMCNYLKLLYENITEPLLFFDTNSKFPNMRDEILLKGHKYKAPDGVIKNTQYSDFVYGHKKIWMDFCEGKIVHIYRNPLDVIISSYFYHYKYRPEKEQKAANPAELIDEVLLMYCDRYAFMRDVAKMHNNVLRISYENMMKEPEAVFSMVINWLNIPLDISKLQLAIKFSSKENVHKEEETKGALYSHEGFKGFFTRDGSTGQWKQYFKDEDMKKITSILAKHHIQLSEFITE